MAGAAACEGIQDHPRRRPASRTVALVASMEEPYGRLVDTSLCVVTWNVWGKFGPWQKRQTMLEQTLVATSPDLVLLQESWADVDGESQCRLLGERLGLPHHSLRCRAGLRRLGTGQCHRVTLAAP